MLTLDVDGIPELARAFERTSERLELELRDASLEAARKGIENARADHPRAGGRIRGATKGLEGWYQSLRYTDRTGHLSGVGDGGDDENSHAEQTEDGEAVMVWPVEYADFVDKGTSRSRPYPFTPGAELAAERALERATRRAVKTTAAAFKGT